MIVIYLCIFWYKNTTFILQGYRNSQAIAFDNYYQKNIETISYQKLVVKEQTSLIEEACWTSNMFLCHKKFLFPCFDCHFHSIRRNEVSYKNS